jgi:hypothetical protein
LTATPQILTFPSKSHASFSKGAAMMMHFYLGPIISLIAGILILIQPRLLNNIVAIYLIIIGILGLVPH